MFTVKTSAFAASLILLLSSTTTVTGCIPMSPSNREDGTPLTYIAGELQGTKDAPFDKVWGAAEDALQDLGFVVTLRERGGSSGKLVARGEADKKVTLALGRVSDAVTDIRIRVDLIGDPTLSRLIFQKMEGYL